MQLMYYFSAFHSVSVVHQRKILSPGPLQTFTGKTFLAPLTS